MTALLIALSLAGPFVATATLFAVWRATIIRRWSRAGIEAPLLVRLLQRVNL
jgi:hypothetical protein